MARQGTEGGRGRIGGTREKTASRKGGNNFRGQDILKCSKTMAVFDFLGDKNFPRGCHPPTPAMGLVLHGWHDERIQVQGTWNRNGLQLLVCTSMCECNSLLIILTGPLEPCGPWCSCTTVGYTTVLPLSNSSNCLSIIGKAFIIYLLLGHAPTLIEHVHLCQKWGIEYYAS